MAEQLAKKGPEGDEAEFAEIIAKHVKEQREKVHAAVLCAAVLLLENMTMRKLSKIDKGQEEVGCLQK